jgi:hypothetical protein
MTMPVFQVSIDSSGYAVANWSSSFLSRCAVRFRSRRASVFRMGPVAEIEEQITDDFAPLATSAVGRCCLVKSKRVAERVGHEFAPSSVANRPMDFSAGIPDDVSRSIPRLK